MRFEKLQHFRGTTPGHNRQSTVESYTYQLTPDFLALSMTEGDDDSQNSAFPQLSCFEGLGKNSHLRMVGTRSTASSHFQTSCMRCRIIQVRKTTVTAIRSAASSTLVRKVWRSKELRFLRLPGRRGVSGNDDTLFSSVIESISQLSSR